MKLTRIAILFMVLASMQVFAAVPRAAAVSFWCSDGASTPCFESATRNGTDVPPDDPTWQLYRGVPPGGSEDFQWGVSRVGHHDLGIGALGDVWVVKIDVGTIIPRVVFTHGDNVTVQRIDDGDSTYQVKVTANPVVILGECDQSAPWPWPCPTTATQEWDGYLDGEVTDYGVWADPVQRESMYGLNFNSNIAATSLPPEIINDPATGAQQLLIRLANPHEDMAHHTFVGFAHQRIPNSFLRAVYEVDAPASLTTGGLTPVVTGSGAAAVSVSLEPSGGAVLVDATGVTFSARKLVVKRGVITPTRPTDVHAVRLGPAGGRVRFDPATPRGSRITGYRARCVHNASVVTASGSGSPLQVTGLHSGVPYDCRVRAKSKAGLGAPSVSFRMPAHPG